MAMIPFLTANTTTDALHDMYICCESAKALSGALFQERVAQYILSTISNAKKDHYMLKNKRNISLNQNIPNTSMPVLERMNLTGWDPWE